MWFVLEPEFLAQDNTDVKYDIKLRRNMLWVR